MKFKTTGCLRLNDNFDMDYWEMPKDHIDFERTDYRATWKHLPDIYLNQTHKCAAFYHTCKGGIMSTNFYWRIQGGQPKVTLVTGDVVEISINQDSPIFHIGKRSSNTFSWAQDPESVLDKCRQFAGKIIVDEYKRQYTGAEFIVMLRDCQAERTDSIGQEFF